MADKLGEVFVEIAGRTDRLLASMREAEKMSSAGAQRIEASFARIRLNVDNSLAKKSFADLEQMQARLKAAILNKISINADPRGLENARAALVGVEAKMASVRAAAQGAGASIGVMGGTIGKLVAGLGGLYLLSKIMGFLNDALDKFSQRQVALQGVRATLHSMGLEEEYNAGELLKMADGIKKFNDYAISTNEVLDLSAFLLSFENITKETLPRATQVVVDLSKKMQTDLKSAALAVGLALDNPTEGLGRLSRAGVRFTKDEKEVIQALVDSGQAAKAQDEIFDKLEMKVGGFAKSTVDDLDKLLKRWDEFILGIKRAVGGFLEMTLIPLQEGLLSLVPTSAVEEFERLSASLKKVDSSVVPMVTRFEQLSAAENLSAAEHQELSKLVLSLAAEFPNAITQWDAYGKAIGISASKIRELIEAERARLKFVNASAIQELFNQYGRLNERMAEQQRILQAGGERKTLVHGDVSQEVFVRYSDEKLKQVQDDLAKMGELKKGIEAQYKLLTGETTAPEKPAEEGAGAVPTRKKIDQMVMEQRLSAEREVIAAQNKLNEQKIRDDYEREKRAAADRLSLKLREIEDEGKTATKEKPADDEALNNRRRAANLVYRSELEAAEREHQEKLARLAKEALDKKLAFEARYDSEVKQFDRDLYDQRIRNHSLSAEEYKAYLDRLLEYDVKSLEAKNKLIEEYNKKNPNAPLATFDVGTFKKEGEKENKEQTDEYARSKREKRLKEWEKDNKMLAEGIKSLANTVEDSWGSAINDLLRGTANLGEGLTRMWRGIADAVIAEVSRMIAKMLVLLALRTILGFVTGGASEAGIIVEEISTASRGGRFTGGPRGVRRMAFGGSFVVPSGYSNDSYPMFVESGERVTVTPANKVRGESFALGALIQKLDILNMNILNRKQKVSGEINVDVRGRTDGRDIYVTNKKASRVYTRLR